MKPPGTPRALQWSLVLALLGLGLVLAPRATGEGPRGPRLLRPLRELGAQLLWIRFQRARLAGESVRALDFAERALDLDPASNEGWQALADHLALDLASREREPDPARRRALFEAALEILDRGRGLAADPGALDFAAALLFLVKADADPELIPGGRREALTRAAEGFERAARSGHRDASELARLAREEAER